MNDIGTTHKRRGLASLAGLALIAALLVPVSLTLAVSPAAGGGHCGYSDYEEGVSQGEAQGGPACCPNGELGHWEWGGYAGQNLSFCDSPPYEPPATAPPPTAAPAAAPKKAAPKKAAAAAKPTFTG